MTDGTRKATGPEGASATDDLTQVLDDAAYNGDATATIDDPDRGNGVIANAVTGPEGSNCAESSADPDCSTSGIVKRPPPPDKDKDKAKEKAMGLPLADTGIDAWYLALAAAATVALGTAVTAAARNRR